MQVSGELSNDGQPMRRFMQTFVLAPGEVSTFYCYNNFKRPPPWFQQGKVEIAAVTRVISWWSTFSILLPTSNLLSHKSLKTNSWFYLVCIALKHRKIRNKSLFS